MKKKLDNKKVINKVKIIRKDLILESCNKEHQGCYIRFQKWNKNLIKHTDERNDCLIDVDKDDNVVGIEFYNGLKIKRI